MPNATNHRMQRIADQIQRDLAQLLRTKVNDPRFHALTITAVNVAPDMANASVYISLLEEQHMQETLSALNKAAGFFRRELAHSLNLRITPRLRFIYDQSILRGNRLSTLIDQVTKKPEDP